MEPDLDTSTVTDGTTPLGKGAATRRAVLDAAIERFGRDGFRSTSVADIARDARVGGTVPYAYFANKEALFTAALDEDAAGVIHEGVSHVFDDVDRQGWRSTLILTLVEALDHHPLARRVLSGLEPHVTSRMLDIPTLEDLRTAVAQRIRDDQARGTVRSDIDAAAISRGAVAIIISVLMGVLQFGTDGVERYGDDVLAVFTAALDPPN